jgi:hypothetical protein
MPEFPEAAGFEDRVDRVVRHSRALYHDIEKKTRRCMYFL